MRAVAVLSLLLPGCLLDLTPGAATLIDCTRNDECPKDWICLDDVGRCAPAKDVLRLRGKRR